MSSWRLYMAILEFPEPVSEEYFDVLVEVGFEATLTPRDTVLVLQTILETITSKIGSDLFEGLTHLELTEKILRIQFRFYNKPANDVNKSREDSSRLKMQFIFLFIRQDRPSIQIGGYTFPTK